MDEAVFGFGVVDNKIICGGIIFPLFISDHEKGRCSFTYLGNYTATKLEPVTWDELSNEVRFASFHERSLKLTSPGIRSGGGIRCQNCSIQGFFSRSQHL